MKKVIFLIAAIGLVACGGLETESHRSQKSSDSTAAAQQMGTFSLAGVANYLSAHPEADTIEVGVTGDDGLEQISIFDRQTPAMEMSLLPGSYLVAVTIFNNEGAAIRTGEATVDIRAGLATLARIELFQTDGTLDVELIDGDAPPTGGTPTIHALGVYQSRSDHSFGYHPVGDLTVTINGEGPVVLLLGSYEPTNWIIKAGPGVDVQKVVAMGYHTQTVTGANEAEVTTACYDFCTNSDYGYFYKYPSTNYTDFFTKAAGYAELDAGAVADSIQSAYDSQAFTIEL